MNIENSTALVTGANRGLGRVFTRQLLSRGARAVYATARRPETLDALRAEYGDRVRTLAVDITREETIQAARDAAADVDLLVNNAGIATGTPLVTGELDAVRAELDTHFWGTLRMTRAFAPVLAANGGGAIINVMSALSFISDVGHGAYAVGKAAQWQLTNAMRLELAAQGTHVLAVHLAATDTDMMAGIDIPKNDPEVVISAALDALVEGRLEMLDAQTAGIKQLLSSAPERIYPQLADVAH